jgi:hypothetical protein
MKKKSVIILGVLALLAGVILYVMYQWMSGLAGGGGVNQEVPDTVIVGQPTALHLYASLTGGSASMSIDKVYPAATFFYRLSGESVYQSILGRNIPLPPNYQAVVSKSLNYKAFEFIVPPYSLNTTGEIEYYFELQTPSNPNGAVQRIEGLRNIQIKAFNPLENIDKTGTKIIED